MENFNTRRPALAAGPATQPGAADRLLALLEVLTAAIVAPVVIQILFAMAGVGPDQILNHAFYIFPFLVAEGTLTLLLIAFLLKMRGETRARIGLIFPHPGREALIGLACLPLLFLSAQVVGLFFYFFLPQYISERNPLLEIIRTRFDLLLFLISSAYVGGIKEEIQRAFILERFRLYLGGTTAGLVVWSAAFGLLHFLQGPDSAASAGVLGLLFGLLYLWRGTLLAVMAAHTLFDIVTLFIYWNFLAP